PRRHREMARLPARRRPGDQNTQIVIGAATNPPPEAGRCRRRLVDRADTVRWQGYLRAAAPEIRTRRS
ncbi:MAG: hypothetical protein RLP09_47380, partial [Sandaracinaceae bacterium]